ncbi:MAG: hypothetical protein LZF85_05120, partial [Nitrosomonas sp.]|uniref:hypothetical protein n=1 Tax=Nitrosomonas sp. TaxID=42353 RepID=UPI0025E7D76C
HGDCKCIGRIDPEIIDCLIILCGRKAEIGKIIVELGNVVRPEFLRRKTEEQHQRFHGITQICATTAGRRFLSARTMRIAHLR